MPTARWPDTEPIVAHEDYPSRINRLPAQLAGLAIERVKSAKNANAKAETVSDSKPSLASLLLAGREE